MSKRYRGGIISATPPTTSGTSYTGVATGIWTLEQALQARQAGNWPKGLSAPNAPTIGTATAGNAQASVTFTAPSDNGGTAITGYTVTSSPGSLTGTGSSSPIVVAGLTNGTAYTFTVTATNAQGTSPASSASNSITPSATNKASAVEYLVVAGGGGGAADDGGGGGAGGLLTASGFAVSSGSAITVTIGAGGSGATTPSNTDAATKGGNSVFSSITSTGGGAGVRESTDAKKNGGSGGGAGYSGGIPGTGIAGPPRQGYDGGSPDYTEAGGGGGAGAVGSGGVRDVSSGNGGIGVESSITGTATYYAGGGGGGGRVSAGGAGGSGGGGLGQRVSQTGSAGTANTGGGGGGAGDVGSPKNGFNGGSGVVIIRYADTFDDAVSTTGSPTFTNTGGYKIYKWTSSGSITF